MVDKKEPSKHLGKYVQMNFDLAGFKAGQRWLYEFAPEIVQLWADLPGIRGDKRIVTILDEAPEMPIDREPFTCPKCGYKEGEPIEDEPEPTEPTKIEITESPSDDKSKDDDDVVVDPVAIRCKHIKGDGSRCSLKGKKIRDNGYCYMHQKFAPVETPEVPKKHVLLDPDDATDTEEG